MVAVDGDGGPNNRAVAIKTAGFGLATSWGGLGGPSTHGEGAGLSTVVTHFEPRALDNLILVWGRCTCLILFKRRVPTFDTAHPTILPVIGDWGRTWSDVD